MFFGMSSIILYISNLLLSMALCGISFAARACPATRHELIMHAVYVGIRSLEHGKTFDESHVFSCNLTSSPKFPPPFRPLLSQCHTHTPHQSGTSPGPIPRGSQDLNARLGVGEGGGVLKLLKKFTNQTKNWSIGRQFHSQLLFSYSNVLYTVYRHISDS